MVRKQIVGVGLQDRRSRWHEHEVVEDAGRNAVETASATLRDLRVAEVALDLKVEGGKAVRIEPALCRLLTEAEEPGVGMKRNLNPAVASAFDTLRPLDANQMGNVPGTGIRARHLEWPRTDRNCAGTCPRQFERGRSVGAHPFAVLHRRNARLTPL